MSDRPGLVVVSTGTSNIRSVVTAFAKMGVPAEVTDRPSTVERAVALVLPGVGAFGEAMANLRRDGTAKAICAKARNDGTPLLGICLGMQLLADSSEERGEHEGLGLVPGRVVRLAPRDAKDRVPNFGWHPVAWRKESPLAASGEDRSFYFVHSFHLVCAAGEDVAGTITFGGGPVTAAVAKDNIVATQFHPEKSQDAGLDMLARFVAHIGLTPLIPGT